MSMLNWMNSGAEPFFYNNSAWNLDGDNILVTTDSGLNGIASDNDLPNKNDSDFNVTYFGEKDRRGYEIDAVGYFLTISTLILVLLCWICNAVVVRALNQLGDEKMKVNFLLKNAILGDILLSISIAVRTIFSMTGLLQNTNTGIVVLCANVLYAFYGYFSVFYQIFTSMSVACDRFYSILKPIQYHSMRYSKGAKFAITIVILAVVISLAAPVSLLKLEPGKPFITICYGAYKRSFYSSVLHYVILSSVFFTLAIYCGVLCLIAYHRRVHRNTLGEINENQTVRRRQASLAITFFMIHLTYVVMYIPGPIYFTFRPPGLNTNLNYYFTQITLMIYLSNTVIDPLIYIFRIKSIRNVVRKMFGHEQKKEVPSTLSQNTTI